MQGRAFLDLAREVLRGATEAHRRGAVIHAYYALLLESRDALASWGRPAPPGPGVHAHVRLRLTYSPDQDLKQIGMTLDQLVRERNAASYDLRPLPAFSSPAVPAGLVQQAANGLALLDAIDGDPSRRAAAIASLPP
jgi:hypothetical protein